MTLLTDDRRAATAVPLTELLAERWSPRSFDPDAVLDDDTVTALLEAARWAPSASNHQPRRFVVARRGSAAFERITAALASGNRPWAPAASLYVVAIALTRDADGKPYRWAEYDTGQAVAALTVQATAMGLGVHQMGGFDAAAIVAGFALPEHAVPVTVSAVGVPAPADRLPERYRARETAERTRTPLGELVLVRE